MGLPMRPTVLFIPGNMCDARLWNGGNWILRKKLAERGFVTNDIDAAQDATISAMAQRALSAVDGPLLPVGFSMGAIIALAMARLAPGRIAAMALFGLNAGADLPERSVVRLRQQAEVRDGGLERVIVEELKPNYLATANRRDHALLALLRDMGMELGPDVFLAQSEALRTRDDLREVLSEAQMPILLGCGIEDDLCPPAWHREWAARAADSRLAIFARAGHMVPLETPLEFADTILAWMEERVLV